MTNLRDLTVGLLGALLTGCGAVELSEDARGVGGGDELGRPSAPDVALVREALQTTQGRTPQGRTPQGRTPQGRTVEAERIDKLFMKVPLRFFGTHTVDGYDQVALAGTKLRVRVPAQVREPPRRPGGGRVAATEVANASAAAATAARSTEWVDAPRGTVLTVRGLQQYTNMEATLDARIVATRVEESGSPGTPNLTEGRVAEPLTFYSLELSQGDGTWAPMCNTEEGNWGLFTQGYWSNTDLFDNYVEQTDASDRYLGFSCLDGVSAKCVRWGYMPWRTERAPSDGSSQALLPLYKACVHAGMADYCGTLSPYTEDGTLIDIWDAYGFVRKTPENAYEPGFSNETSWNSEGALCVESARWRALGLACTEPTYVRPPVYCEPRSPGCMPQRKPAVVNANSFFENGQRDACVARQQSWGKKSLLFVDTSTYCTHPTGVTGSALRADCSACSAAVCKSAGFETCCTKQWTAACVSKASTACRFRAPPEVSPPVANSRG